MADGVGRVAARPVSRHSTISADSDPRRPSGLRGEASSWPCRRRGYRRHCPGKSPFKSVKQLGGSPFFAQNGLLFLSTEQLTGITKSLTRSARLLRELVTDPSLRGAAGMPGSWRTADGRIRVEMTPSGDPDDNENIRTFARAVLRCERGQPDLTLKVLV